MHNDEIMERLTDIKRRAKIQKRAQCVTIIFGEDGFVKMFDASGTVKKINSYTKYVEGSPVGYTKMG